MPATQAKPKRKRGARQAAAKPAPAPPPVKLPSYPALPLPPVITRTLNAVSARQLSVAWMECLVLLLAVVPGLWLLQATADWFFDLPWAVRFLLLLMDLAVVGYIVWRFAIVPWRRRLTHTTAALQVEKELPAFRSGLISAVQLSKDRSGVPGGATELVEALIASVAGKLQGLKVSKHVVKTKQLVRFGKIMVAVLLLAMGAAMLAGSKTPVLVQRILLANVPLPKQTIVIPITRDGSVAIGTDIPLSARADGVIPRSGRIEVEYDNGERQDISVNPTAEDESVFTFNLRNVHQPFTYRFVLNDGVSPRFRVDAKAPPVLAKLDALQLYPAYTTLENQVMQMGNLQLLAGSTLQLKGASTQPLESARVVLEGVNEEVELTVAGQEVSGSFQVPKEGLNGISIHLVNEDGVASQDNTLYQVQLVPDAVPQVELLVPPTETMSIVPDVTPTLVYTVRDDFKLQRVELKYEVLLPEALAGDADPAEGEAAGPAVGSVPLPLPESSSAGQPQQYVWNISQITPAPVVGASISYWIEAQDFNDVTGPGIGESQRKSFTIISKEQKQAELLEKLGDIASELENVYNKQKKASETLDSAIRQNQP